MKKLCIILLGLYLFFPGKAQYSNDLIIKQLLKTDTTSTGQKISYPIFDNDEVTILKITIPSGKSTGWHRHSFPVFAYVLKGKLTVELDGGRTVQYAENTSFSEVINTWHNGINKEKEDVELIAVFMGGKGIKLSEHKD